MNQKFRRVRKRIRGKEQSYFKGVFAEATITGRNNQDSAMIRRLSLTITTMWMIVDDSLTVFSGIINRIVDKLQQLTVKSQGCTFSDTVYIRSVCSKWKTTTCAGAQVKLVWIQKQLQVDMGDVTTCKFVGDASLNNDLFINCVIFWILQISIMGQICSFLWTRKNKKAFSFRGLRPLYPHRGLCPLDSRWGLCPQTPL